MTPTERMTIVYSGVSFGKGWCLRRGELRQVGRNQTNSHTKSGLGKRKVRIPRDTTGNQRECVWMPPIADGGALTTAKMHRMGHL